MSTIDRGRQNDLKLIYQMYSPKCRVLSNPAGVGVCGLAGLVDEL